MAGTPCEGYPEVTDYWLRQVKNAMEMGFDGVDFRLQNHSSMVTDYVEYGYNEPIVARYRDKYGVDILQEEADPLKIMQVRGAFYADFLEQAASLIHSYGKKVQVHLRHANEAPTLNDEFNELGFWAMPKVQVDWKRVVDLADEITLKHYYHNAYDTAMAAQIKRYANAKNKRVWVHAYIQQAGELNEGFLDAVEQDSAVQGILLYEFSNAIFQPRRKSDVSLNTVRYHLEKLGFSPPGDIR
ncbi:hypothetical protein SAMN05421747_10631 [Parapedobacter composti]|uniref:Sugar phosphate isomerase/epimerase n=1 Tax=Parapedobacter composti TaxID=623281 RepID=A0A1I1H786_9SPHI|nr:hypothetical protein [Parapedobacter composti]SFC19575.1 hypothetical protein SAMN05421747_10631 [Parapedobacter composti]